MYCCKKQKENDDEQIKHTVRKFWKAVRENDLQTYNSLIYDSKSYDGVTASELFFLNKHYKEINSKKDFLHNIIIKDTTDVFMPSVKMKYVQYTYKKENDSNNLRKPLIITLMFYKPESFDKIYNPGILQNNVGWDKEINIKSFN